MLAEDTEREGRRRVVGLTGYARSGKDTVGQHLVKTCGFTRVSFADAVRDAVYTLNPIMYQEDREEFVRVQDIVDEGGWEATKVVHDEGRRLLQVMGTEVGRMLFGENVWVDIADRKIQAIDGPVVITDVRFDNEAEYVRANGGEVWWIYRAGVGPVNSHASDNIDFPVDRIIPNNGSLDELFGEIDSLINYR